MAEKLYHIIMHYGDVSAILSYGRGKNMGDGWEREEEESQVMTG